MRAPASREDRSRARPRQRSPVPARRSSRAEGRSLMNLHAGAIAQTVPVRLPVLGPSIGARQAASASRHAAEAQPPRPASSASRRAHEAPTGDPAHLATAKVHVQSKQSPPGRNQHRRQRAPPASIGSSPGLPGVTMRSARPRRRFERHALSAGFAEAPLDRAARSRWVQPGNRSFESAARSRRRARQHGA